MANITKEWTKVASKTWTSGSFSVTYYLDAKVVSQSVANNQSVIQTRLRSVRNSYSFGGHPYKFTCTYASTRSGSSMFTVETETIITSPNKTISHNSDGSKSISLSATASITGLGLSVSLSGTATLPKINRLASITSAPNFTDEDNPTIKYSNPAGNSVTGLKTGIFTTDGMTTLAAYRDVSKTGSSYTFNLTDEERNRLREYCANAKSTAVAFFIRTTYGTTNYNRSVSKTLTIVNANPTMTYTKVENNSQVINYLGSSSADTVIKNVSNVTISVTPTTYKSATVSSVIINHNEVNITATESEGVYSATFDITGDNTTITTKDSRGNTVSEVWTPTVIDYQKVKQNSFSFKRVNPTSSNVRLKVDSLYYQQTFGSTANVPTVKYKIGENGTWITVPSSQYNIDTESNKLTIDYTIVNAIDYRNSDTFYLEVSDLLSSWNNKNQIYKGIPVFEFGDDEVQVNGNLLLADINRENIIDVRGIVDKNIITVGLNTNTNVSIGTAWTYYTLNLNTLNTSLGDKLTFNASTHRIIVGDGVSYVKVSAYGLARGITNDIEINIRRNGAIMGTAANHWTNATHFMNLAITDILVPVSSGDYIDMAIRTGATGTVVVGGAQYTKLTVEVVK